MQYLLVLTVMSIEKTYIMINHHYEEQTSKIVVEVGWSLKGTNVAM